MASLREGILNQPMPKLQRANRRPIYLAVGGLIAVVLLGVSALVLSGRTKLIPAGKSTAPPASPATGALKALGKKWDPPVKVLPVAADDPYEADPDTSGPLRAVAPTKAAVPGSVPMATPPVPGVPVGMPGGMARPVGARMASGVPPMGMQAGMPSMPVMPMAMAPQLPGAGGAGDARAEERAAWESPMVPREGFGQAQGQGVPAAQMPLQGAGAGYHGSPVGGVEKPGPGDELLNQNLAESKLRFAGVGQDKASPIVVATGQGVGYVVKAGWDIPAILEQGGTSDLPGELRARVRENVYDTATGKYVLIPQNSILVGAYNSEVAYGQNRVQVNWDRLQRPGTEPTIFLNKMNGVDADGLAGLTGSVNNHYKRLIGFALLSSAFAAGITVSQNRNSSAYGYPSNGELAAAAVGQQMGEFGRKITERNLNRPPTIQILAGTRFNVRVDRDIIFVSPYKP